MAFNRIQFQHGMLIPNFLRRFCTETRLAEAFDAARWPGGAQCLRRAAADHHMVGQGAHRLVQCNWCRHQTILTQERLLELTKLSLTIWPLAIDPVNQAKTGLSALALNRQLRATYPTARRLHHKVSRANARKDSAKRLIGAPFCSMM